MNKKPLNVDNKLKKKGIGNKGIWKLVTLYVLIYENPKTDMEERVGTFTDLKTAKRLAKMDAFAENKSIEKYKIYTCKLGETKGDKFLAYIIDLDD